MQDGDVWTEMGSSNRLHLFDEITVFDRWAAHRHNQQAQAWNKVSTTPWALFQPTAVCRIY